MVTTLKFRPSARFLTPFLHFSDNPAISVLFEHKPFVETIWVR
jgi:hypothetical protein